MMLFSLPTWIVTRILIPFLPPSHPWHGRPFTLADWSAKQTDFCRFFDMVLWAMGSMVAVLYFQLLSA